MSEFTMPAVPEMQEYLGEVAEELVTLFGISRAEAVARINRAWGNQVFNEWPDLLAHEEPEHWAYGLYYEGDVPYWEPDADRSQWRIRQAPPRDSPAWTLEA